MLYQSLHSAVSALSHRQYCHCDDDYSNSNNCAVPVSELISEIEKKSLGGQKNTFLLKTCFGLTCAVCLGNKTDMQLARSVQSV